MGTLLLIFFIFFIVIPIVRIAVAAYTVRRKMRDAMRQMYDAQQRAQRGPQTQQRKAGWSSPGERGKKIGKDVGEYVKFEELPADASAEASSGAFRRPEAGGYEPQVTDVEWEDIK